MNALMKKLTIMTLLIPGSIAISILSSSTTHILAEYINYPAALVTGMVTLPALSILIGLVVCPMLMKQIPAKVLILVGLSGCLVSGLLPLIVTEFYAVVGLRFLLGIFTGLVLPLQATYAATYPEEERALVLGLTTTVASLVTAVLIAASGFVVNAFGWRMTFSLYSVLAIPLMLSILYLPMNPQQAASKGTVPAQKQADMDTKKESLFGKKYRLPLGGYFFLLTMNYGFMSMVSVEMAQYLKNTGMGDSRVSGLMMTAFFFGSIVSGLISQPYLQRAKHLAFTGIFVECTVGCVLMWCAPSLPFVAMGAFLLGMIMTLINVVIIFELSTLLPLELFTSAAAVSNMFAFILQFIAPMLFLFVLDHFAGGSFRTVFLIYAFIQGIMIPVSALVTGSIQKSVRR